MRNILVIVISALFFLIISGHNLSSAQESKQVSAGEFSDLKKEIEAIKEGQKAIQKDIEEIKNLLRAKPSSPEFKEAVVSIKGDQFRGNKDAKLVLIEFFDYQ